MFEGVRRPWDGGTLWHEDGRLAAHLLSELGRDGALTLGDQKPYSGASGVYTLDRHCWGMGLPASGFEVTNDLLRRPADISAWADRLAGALAAVAA